MISVDNGSVEFGGRALFSDVTFNSNEKDRIAMIFVNISCFLIGIYKNHFTYLPQFAFATGEFQCTPLNKSFIKLPAILLFTKAT